MKDETRFRQNKVLPFLKTLKNTKYTPIQQMTFVGDPDFILCIRGKYVDLELKTNTGGMSRMQIYKMEETTRCGGLSLIAKPMTWDKVSALLQKLDSGEEI